MVFTLPLRAMRARVRLAHFALVRRFSRTVKLLLTFLCLLSAFASSFAGESGLIQTFQPLEGFEAGEPVVTAVTCYAHNTHVGWHQAIRYITAKYVPPSFDDMR